MTVTFAFLPSVSNEARAENTKINKTLGLPEHRGSGRLAVVGGGPSIASHVEELRKFDGTIWAVNGTINWCLDHGIDNAWFYTIDAAPIERWVYDLSRIKRAVVCIDCAPSLIETLKGAEITTLPETDGGPTSANAADMFAIDAGYHGGVTFYGCEASFATSTHAFQSFPITDWVTVRVGGEDFVTKPEFLEQAKVMSEVIRRFPQFYSERSGGLLRAMVKHGMEYELIDISPSVRNILIEKAAA